MATANLSSRLTMDDSDFNRKARRAADTAKSASDRMRASFAGAAKSFAGIFAGAMTIRGLKGMVDSFDRIGKLASRFDTTAEAIQKIGFIASQNGADVELFADALSKAGRNLADVTNTTAKDAAKRLGLDVDAFIKADPVEKLAMLSDAFIKSGASAESAAAMYKIVGRQVDEMIPALRSGGDAVRDLGDSISVLSTASVRDMERLNDAFDKMATNAKTNLMKIAVGWERIIHFGKSLLGGEMDIRMQESLGLAIRTPAPVDPNKKTAAEAIADAMDSVSSPAVDTLAAAFNPGTANQGLSSIGELNLKAITGGGSSVQDKILDVNKSLLERFEDMQELLRQGIAPGGTM